MNKLEHSVWRRLQARYAERIAPNSEETQALATVAAYGEAMLEQQKDPRRIWDNADACDADMEGEVDLFIQRWSARIAALY